MPAELPRLIVARTEARQKIEVQIEEGRRILGLITQPQSGLGLGSKKAFDDARNAFLKWQKFNTDLLNSLFKDDSPMRDYSLLHHYPLAADAIGHVVNRLERQIAELESIRDRLVLFPVIGEKSQTDITKPGVPISQGSVFIVHGHDRATKESVARFIERLGLHTLILHEQPDGGRTIIEKFENYASGVAFAIVLLTEDDLGASREKPTELKARARQNVLLELGFFLGKLGRSRVRALIKGKVEIPSDYLGVLYIEMRDDDTWKIRLAKELKNAGLEVNLEKAL